jgi:hypothetical protein
MVENESNDEELYSQAYPQEYTYQDPLDQNPMQNSPYGDQAQDQADAEEDEQFLGYSESKPKEGLYQLFQKVLDMPKSTKIGNVDRQELGSLGISIRESLRVALIGKTFGHRQFANFFENQANIITDTSMAKRGWLAELFVTSKKSTSRGDWDAQPQQQMQPATEKPETSKLSSLFGSKKK